jgi:hypothetical protein
MRNAPLQSHVDISGKKWGDLEDHLGGYRRLSEFWELIIVV